jgi:hypothetical protein
MYKTVPAVKVLVAVIFTERPPLIFEAPVEAAPWAPAISNE